MYSTGQSKPYTPQSSFSTSRGPQGSTETCVCRQAMPRDDVSDYVNIVVEQALLRKEHEELKQRLARLEAQCAQNDDRERRFLYQHIEQVSINTGRIADNTGQIAGNTAPSMLNTVSTAIGIGESTGMTLCTCILPLVLLALGYSRWKNGKPITEGEAHNMMHVEMAKESFFGKMAEATTGWVNKLFGRHAEKAGASVNALQQGQNQGGMINPPGRRSDSYPGLNSQRPARQTSPDSRMPHGMMMSDLPRREPRPAMPVRSFPASPGPRRGYSPPGPPRSSGGDLGPNDRGRIIPRFMQPS